MWAYVIRRILATIPVLAIVALVVFSILHFAPGDPAALIAGDQATPEQIVAIRAKLGLDRPFHEQFILWIGNALHGDLGTSIFSNRPVALLFLQRLEPTIALADHDDDRRGGARGADRACWRRGRPGRRSTAA